MKIVIVGGGLVATLLAIFLAKRDFEVHIYEKRKDMR
jgi:kynurenine 3-monooxygenase